MYTAVGNDDGFDAYGWTGSAALGDLTVVGIKDLFDIGANSHVTHSTSTTSSVAATATHAPVAASCSGVITTGGGPSRYITGAADMGGSRTGGGAGSVTAMASDALYVVDVLNDRPDDLHYPVYGLEGNAGFLNIFYTQ